MAEIPKLKYKNGKPIRRVKSNYIKEFNMEQQDDYKMKSTMTAVDFVEAEIYRKLSTKLSNEIEFVLDEVIEQAKQMEEKQIKDGMMYALDEDGHTGDWKIRFVDTYYTQMYEKP